MKKRRLLFAAVASLIGVILASCWLWQHGQPRREAVTVVSHLAKCLASPNGSDLLDSVLMPVAIQSRTPAEQKEFLVKALSDEISPAGVMALKRHAEFGLAKAVFPTEALKWCAQAGVNANDCVAFKMERDGIRAEVLLVHEGQNYRVVRCNNVKQMAGVN
jgi:hypothetical protein